MVQRTEEQDCVERTVREPEIPGVAMLGDERAVPPRSVHMVGHRVDEHHIVAAFGERGRVYARATADIEDPGPWSDPCADQLLHPLEFQPTLRRPVPQPIGLGELVAVVVLDPCVEVWLVHRMTVSTARNRISTA